jgi:prepilin-type N-terminal cleavage/methylation domain-containing protein
VKSLHRNDARAGFTLVEVLLTLLIMGMLMLSMTQILTAARNSRDTIHNIQETQLAGPAIMDLVERDLRGMFVYNRARATALRVENRAMLGLDGDSLDFVASTDGLVFEEIDNRFQRADYNEVGYRCRPSMDSDDFLEIYRREDFGVDEEPFEGGRYVFLHDRVKAFDIQVFLADGIDDNEPLDEWGMQETDPEIGVPTRIEISLTLELAPRIQREQLRIVPLDRRTVTYRRVIRLPTSLAREDADLLVPTIPRPGTPAAAGLPVGGGGGGEPGFGDPGDTPFDLDGNPQRPRTGDPNTSAQEIFGTDQE